MKIDMVYLPSKRLSPHYCKPKPKPPICSFYPIKPPPSLPICMCSKQDHYSSWSSIVWIYIRKMIWILSFIRCSCITFTFYGKTVISVSEERYFINPMLNYLKSSLLLPQFLSIFYSREKEMLLFDIWRLSSQSELTQMIFNMGLTHLGSEASIYLLSQLI